MRLKADTEPHDLQLVKHHFINIAPAPLFAGFK
jgi:hypothetical protein